MIDRLAELEARYEEIAGLLSTPDVASDPSRLAELGRELSRLEPIVEDYRGLRSAQAQMRAMAREEIDRLEGRLADLEADLRLRLVPRDPNDDRNVIVEIRAGTGGEEAALFAADLFRMYARYA